ncbi:MAG: putative Ig domain-containing protein [Verrucomicrobia bacterium]|nr:putative Ig domain-containing protein [Verrucomicrobiota bacterium]
MPFLTTPSLRQLRRSKWIIWVQLVCLLGWTLSAPTLNAVYVQDVNAPGFALNQPASYTPTWDGNGVGDPEPPEGADMSDNDTDGLPAWFEDWYGAVHGAMVNMRGHPDSDHDGATDGNELQVMGTDPLNATSNGSGATDGLWWQLTHADSDGDGLMDWSESNGSGFGGQYGTDMNSSDTDGDGLSDGFEVNTSGTSPTNADTDGNGFTDLEDRLIATDPWGDYDADGLTNAQEAQQTYQAENWSWLRTSMRQADTDGDGLSDGYEVSSWRNGDYKSSSNPLLSSTDRNGLPDPQNLNYLFPSDRYGITGPGTLPNAVAGTTYTSPPFTVANALGAATWAVTAGNLPPTFAFNENYLVGSAPPGSYSFTVQVTDAANRSATADVTLAVDSLPLNITSAALVPEVLFGAPVSHSFTAAGGYGGFSWSVPYGGLPSGLNLSTDGQLSGSATYPGNSTFTVRVADMSGGTAEQWVSLNVTVPALVITSSALSTGVQVNSWLSAAFTAVGGTGNYSWSVPSGSLPWGMSLSWDGQLSGAPYSTGSYWFTVRVTDGSGNYADQGAYMSVSEVPPPPPPEPPQITSYQTLPSGQDGSVYSFDFSASGGSGSYTWSSWWGLPSGLSLSSSGQLAGTLSGSGSYSFTVQVTDGSGSSSSQTFYLYVASVPPPAPPQINGPMTFEASLWTPQSWTLTASGGSGGSYAWSLWNYQLPSSFSLSTDGLLTGNFEGQTGSFSFYAQVSDGSSSSDAWFTVNVTDRDADGDGMLASVERELALELGLPLHDGSRYSVQPGLDDWYVYYHARLAATDGPDEDRDGLGPLLEQVLGTNPTLKDSDGDFRPDGWVHYQAYGRFFDTTDVDGDGLHAVLEGLIGTSDDHEDSDGDTLTDAYEWTYIQYSDPGDDDSDNDGLKDGAELTAGTQARNPDSDDDYLTDYEEVNNLYALVVPTSPLNPDTDGDGTPDHGEVNLTDSDGGGIPDRLEEHWKMKTQDARDEADDYDGDGHSNYAAYLTGWDIHAQFVPQFDTDADGMTNLYELAKGFDPADQKDGADDPDGDFLTNAEEYEAQTSPKHPLTLGYEGETVTDRDDSTGAGVFDENGAPVTRAVLSDYEVAFDQELFLNPTPLLTRGNGPLDAVRAYDDDWDQDGVSNFDEQYPAYGDPTDPRVWQQPLEITTTSLADAQEGAPYTAVLTQVGGQPGFTYTLESGSLPAGLGLDASVPGAWALSGTPTAAGSHTFALRVTDAYQRTDTQQLTLVVAPSVPPLVLALTTTDEQLAGTVGQAYSVVLSAMGALEPVTFSLSGSLPAGLSYDSGTGTISGTPTAATLEGQAAAVTIKLSSGGERQDFSRSIDISQPVVINTAAELPGVEKDNVYLKELNAQGGRGTLVFTKTAGPLPPGLTLSGTGYLTGTVSAGGTYAFTVQAADELGRVGSKEFTLVVSVPPPPLSIVTTALPDAMVGVGYTSSVQATGVGALTFTATGLPDWLQMSASGQFSGTPPSQAEGAFTFTVGVQDEVYDPAVALYRKVSATVALVVDSFQPVSLAIISGNHQMGAPGSTLPLPLVVRATRGNVPLAGLALSFNNFAVNTDANGMASTAWTCPNVEGGFQVPVSCGSGSTTFQAWAVTLASNTPPVSSGDPIAGAAPPAAVTQPLLSQDTEVEVESRYVSEVGGEVEANYSEHVYKMADTGSAVTMLHEGGGVPPYTDTKKNWKTSKGDSGTQPPLAVPLMSSLSSPASWIPGATEGYHFQGKDTEFGYLSDIGTPGGYGAGSWSVTLALLGAGTFYEGGWYGRAKGFYKRTESEVRLKRKSGTGSVRRTFIAVTEEDGVFKSAEPVTLEITEGATESPAHLLAVTASATGKTATKRLLPVEIKVHQPEGFKAPNDAERSYNHAPSTESCATDYFSVWRWEKVKVELRGIPESMLSSLPPNFIKFSTDQNASKTNVLEYEVYWNQVAHHTVTLEIGGSTHRVHFDVPKVGDNNEEEIKEWIIREFGAGGALAARDISYGTRDYVGALYPVWNAKQDAIKHASWAAGLAAYFGEQAAQIIVDSHEKSGFLESYQAFTTTMDNLNNSEGIDLGKGYVEKSSRPSIATWVSTFAQAYDDGILFVWMPRDKSPRMSDGCEGYLRHSDGTHIVQP